MACGVFLVANDAFWGARVVRFRVFKAAGYAPVHSRFRAYVVAMSGAPAVGTGLPAVAERGASALGSVVCEPERYAGAVE